MRHELVHLFSRRWGKLDPPLKSEGLATWLQGTEQGKPIDFRALVVLLGGPLRPPWQLIERSWWSRNLHDSYAIAGSFTGFLITRFGWDVYRDFFRRARAKNFEAIFEEIFRLSLLSAERLWRGELLARRASFEPELTRTVGERRVETAYQGWDFFRCIDEAEALSRAGQASAMTLWWAACAHRYVGNYRQAAELFRQVMLHDDRWVPSWRSWLHLCVGQLSDLQGRRDEALRAYAQALNEPDLGNGEGAVHTQARLYLERPFTERESEQWIRG